MGVTNEGTFFPVSTGAVEPPPAEVEYSQPVGGEPTGAVDGPPDAVTTKFGPSGLRPTGFVEIPVVQTYSNESVGVTPPAEPTVVPTTTGSTRTQRTQQAADSDDGR